MQNLQSKSLSRSLPTRSQLDQMIETKVIMLSPMWLATIGTCRNERSDCTNPKPNEDRASVDPETGTVSIADGITRTKRADNTYPDPSPSAGVAEVFCRSIATLRREYPTIGGVEAVAKIMAAANGEVARFNERAFTTFDFAEQDRAGLAAGFGIVEGNDLWAASIADISLMVVRNGAPEIVAGEKTSHSRPEYNRLGEVKARETLRNRIGNPNAYGALTGEPEALHFVEYSRVPLGGVERVVFITDGLLRVLQEDPAALARLTVPQIIHYARVLDRLNNETDDKTIVLLERVSGNSSQS